jgi:hypothetical protein
MVFLATGLVALGSSLSPSAPLSVSLATSIFLTIPISLCIAENEKNLKKWAAQLSLMRFFY